MNKDLLQRFPNQIIELRPTECVGETVGDILGNLAGQSMDAGYSYALALACARSAPTTAGSDPYAGMVGGLVYGALPTEKEPFDATTTSELYEANVQNYAKSDRLLALNFCQNGLVTLNSWQAIANYLLNNQAGVQMSMTWYSSFMQPNPDGTLPAPSGTTSNHCVAVYEVTSLGLRLKVWVGAEYGQGGYVFLPQQYFSQVFQGANAFNLQGNRWWNLAYTACVRPFLIPDILPQLQGLHPTFT